MELSVDAVLVPYVLVVGFHHEHGLIVEYSYPEAPASLKTSAFWRQVPALSIAEGVHKVPSDFVYFFPSHVHPVARVERDRGGSAPLYGIACYRQISAKELLIADPEVTRSTVQKAVVVLTRLPLFSLLHSHVDTATREYFAQKNFQCVELFAQLYQTLNLSVPRELTSPCPADSPTFLPTVSWGLSPSRLVMMFQAQLLVLFKLVLLESKMVIYGPTGEVSVLVLTLASLFPGGLTTGLNMPKPTEPDEYALELFHKTHLLLPYLPLEQIELLRMRGLCGFVAGSSNMLFMNRPLEWIQVTADSTSGKVQLSVPGGLQDAAALTSADRQFISKILKAVNSQTPKEDETIEDETDDWIRDQFYTYIKSLLCTAAAVPGVCTGSMDITPSEAIRNSPLQHFHVPWVLAWMATTSFAQWQYRQAVDACATLSMESVGHPGVHAGFGFGFGSMVRYVSAGVRKLPPAIGSSAVVGVVSAFSLLKGGLGSVSKIFKRPTPTVPSVVADATVDSADELVVTVPSDSVFDVSLTVQTDAAVIEWWFRVESGDICFCLLKEKERVESLSEPIIEPPLDCLPSPSTTQNITAYIPPAEHETSCETDFTISSPSVVGSGHCSPSSNATPSSEFEELLPTSRYTSSSSNIHGIFQHEQTARPTTYVLRWGNTKQSARRLHYSMRVLPDPVPS